MIQHLWIPGRVPGLNEILTARTRKTRTAPGSNKRFDGYGALKRQWKSKVKICAAAKGLRPMPHAHFVYLLVEPKRDRDPSNVAAGALKLIEDGLQAAGVIPNDGWKQVKSFQVRWCADRKNPGTHVWMSDERVSTERVDALIEGVSGHE